MSQADKLTPKQSAFVTWYVKLLNATRAAEKAGYTGDNDTLRQVGSENLAKPYIKAEIDRRIKASIMPADELLSRVTSTAKMDVSPYTRPDGTIDVQSMADDGLGHLIVGSKPGRNGAEITLANPQTARKMLAGYHRLLGQDVSIDVTASLDASVDTLAALAGQIAAAQAEPAQQDDTADSAD